VEIGDFVQRIEKSQITDALIKQQLVEPTYEGTHAANNAWNLRRRHAAGVLGSRGANPRLRQ
jgi:hypothetical protein